MPLSATHAALFFGPDVLLMVRMFLFFCLSSCRQHRPWPRTMPHQGPRRGPRMMPEISSAVPLPGTEPPGRSAGLPPPWCPPNVCGRRRPVSPQTWAVGPALSYPADQPPPPPGPLVQQGPLPATGPSRNPHLARRSSNARRSSHTTSYLQDREWCQRHYLRGRK